MKKHPGILKLIAFFETYQDWDNTIDRYCRQFKKEFSVYPNIMLAGRETWNAVDTAAKERAPHSSLLNDLLGEENFEEFEEDIRALEPEIIEQESADKPFVRFTTKKYSLEFCLDKGIAADSFVLIFDESPVFDDGADISGGYVRITLT